MTPSPNQQGVVENLERVQERIARAAEGVGREPNDITLVGVTKLQPIEKVQTALAAGLRDIGENRLQEARDKFPQLDLTGIRRHLIGHLQTNKAKYVPQLFDTVHSIDSERIAKTLNGKMESGSEPLPIFIQVNTSGEESKFGIEPETAMDLVGFCLEQQRLQVQGLMTIGPLTDDKQRIVRSFRILRMLADQIQTAFVPVIRKLDLSMGMTGDFEWAIAEGATHVRVGRAIFGERE
ncbi:MAG: YggS family pyridoxal phosphate-dependent enzyme [Candidatus Marinimicrobia bacterium]|nr:YggS family pyridoxal phosphate-dependent enzyme [Candidatus Neomarinimicrobiota bacterium]MCF7839344.1 YggS family pyridoxal phosphate-dependent enzyme [Candidatus Neomarinimicrobiota bacterium]MCF7902170.1 YggS family pyridoxal phosphate-dependent enzyme [Candidatus Neomarinimicrobiota bacterium]